MSFILKEKLHLSVLSVRYWPGGGLFLNISTLPASFCYGPWDCLEREKRKSELENMNNCPQDQTFLDHDASLLYSSGVNPSSVWTILPTKVCLSLALTSIIMLTDHLWFDLTPPLHKRIWVSLNTTAHKIKWFYKGDWGTSLPHFLAVVDCGWFGRWCQCSGLQLSCKTTSSTSVKVFDVWCA